MHENILGAPVLIGAEEVGVPVAPWSRGPVVDVNAALDFGAALGYPLMLKATAGGGGRGIRIIASDDEMRANFGLERVNDSAASFDPDTPADRRMYEALRGGDYETWRNYAASAVEESGQQELLNWMCLAGALKALGRTPASTEFIDTWIFNSSKAFLISPP